MLIFILLLYYSHLAPEPSSQYHCPFNISHSMPQKTLIKHISKCPDRPIHYKTCTYNVSHVMPEIDLKVKYKTVIKI